MPLQDEMTFQRIEVMLDMQAKKINAELAKLREELCQVKEELRKELHASRSDPSFQQAGNAHVQMYADVPPQQQAAPVPRYQQEQMQQPQYAQQGYAQQAYPQQGYPQQAPQQGYPQQPPQGQPQTWNQPYPPQFRGGDKPPSTQPIDRNGVAPSDVSVEKFFNFSNKSPGKK